MPSRNAGPCEHLSGIVPLFGGSFPAFSRREPVKFSEAAVKVGQIAKPDVVGNGAHRASTGSRRAQHPMSARETLVQQESGKRRAIDLEEHLHVARGDAKMCGNSSHRKISTAA